MKKKAIISILAIVFIACTALIISTINNSRSANLLQNANIAKSIETSSSDLITQPQLTSVKGKNVNALYTDSCTSLAELKENSDMIVIGKAVKQEDAGPASVISTFSISKVFKGEEMKEIQILQLRDGSELKVESEYVLFLGKPLDGSGRYFVKGGDQGRFLNSNGKLYNSDKFMTKEIEKLEAKEEKQLMKLVDFINAEK